ncbi:MAG: hypothetical protein R3C05_20825 [Pirellulaceae bacterium]
MASESSSSVGLEPRLIRNHEDGGLWGRIDQISERASRWLNPILIKEARQSLKSRQFTTTFFFLLLASLFWMVIGVSISAPDIYYVPAGVTMLSGYYFLLALPMMAIVPVAAYRSLAAEIEDGTFELLVITNLSSLRIVTGKLGSAILQMMVYFAVLVPCLAFCYLLRGIDVLMITTTLVLVVSLSLLLTTIALFLATIAPTKASQLLSLFCLLGLIFFSEVIAASYVFAELLQRGIDLSGETVMFVVLIAAVGVSLMFLFVKAAAARIGTVTENRSTSLRWIMLAQQHIWIGGLATVALWYEDRYVVMFAAMILTGYWIVMGTLMLGESVEMSPRVLRALPKTTLTRMLLLWLYPGPGTGYVFAIATGCTGLLALGIFAVTIDSEMLSSLFCLLMIGYLTFYLSAVRLIVMPLSRHIGGSFALPIGMMMVLLISGVAGPTIVMALVTGAPSSSYALQEATNWMWSIVHCFSDSVIEPLVVVFMLGLGGCLMLLNLMLLFREFAYRPVVTPERVMRDEAEKNESH